MPPSSPCLPLVFCGREQKSFPTFLAFALMALTLTNPVLGHDQCTLAPFPSCGEGATE